MKITKKKYIFEYAEDTNEVILYNTEGGRYLKMPASTLLKEGGEEIETEKREFSFNENTLTVSAESVSPRFGKISMAFLLNDENIELSFTAEAKEDVFVQETELFRNGRKGMYMVDCIKRFTPAPRNNDGINRSFESVFCDCTMNAYFAPPPLNFCVGNRSGWIAFGLLDLPDSYEYKMTTSLGILVENRGGKLITKKGDTYKAPRLLISFPDTNWESISLFREELAKRNLLPEKRKEIPAWWKRPLLVTYGDQMMDLQYNWYSDADWGCDEFTTDWLRMWLDRAESILGKNNFTVVIDAFWQHEYSTEARVDEERFSDLRQFIDECHARGHKVLLWSAPLIDNPNNGFTTLAQSLGVLSPDRLTGGIVDGKHYVDFTSDKITEYFDELSRKFFGSDPDALDCDGLKMDFLANLRNPAKDVHYQNPENGIGIKEMYRFYDLFQKAAVKVKSDVLLNGSGCDPRFETVMAMNRLHDIQNVYEERELRARASALACPNLLIDSDGAIMLTDWVKETYIKATVYSTPSLYYVNKFHDGIRLPDDEMKSLCALLNLSSQKTDGVPFYNENGDWELVDENGKITAHTFGGDSLFVYDGKGTFNVFSWNGGKLSIPAFGYKFENLPENCCVDNDTLYIDAKPGKVYALRSKKMKLSLEQIKEITKGAVRIEEKEDGISFSRFTLEQELFYKDVGEKIGYMDFYERSRANAGIKFQFETDSHNLGMKFFAIKRSSRNYFSVDVFVNGEKRGYIDNLGNEEFFGDYTQKDLKQGDFQGEIFLGEGTKSVTVYLPWSMQIILKELSLDNGAFVKGIFPKKKILMYGDSITQGHDAIRPSNIYTSLLAQKLGAEEINKGIGGESIRPDFAKLKDDFIPDYVTVAYGTNDWGIRTEEEFKRNCKEFFEIISKNYPDSKIFAISPIWRKDYLEKKGFGPFEKVEKYIKEAVEGLGNVILISGFQLVPNDENYYGDLRVHPNDEGFKLYGENLYKKMKSFLEEKK